MQKIYLLLTVPLLVFGCSPTPPDYPTHDIGYINPENTEDATEVFKPCDSTESIIQYYNTNTIDDAPAYYEGGPKAIRKYILENYPQLNLHQDSGMLTIRFVINCQGQTGYFEVFENDLDFQPTSLNAHTREQLLKITRELNAWKANFHQGSYRDSYMYLIYRIENGKITEILP